MKERPLDFDFNDDDTLVEFDDTQRAKLEKGAKTFEQECEEGRFEFNPNRSFEERCEIARRTAITSDMSYEERLDMQRRRYGL